MGNDGICGECGAANVPLAHFCSRCGHALDSSPQTVGRVAHPSPAATPEGYRKCGLAADLFYRVGSAWGGSRLLGTENLGISIFNGGYALKDVDVQVSGLDELGHVLFEFRQKLTELPRRAEVEFEVPSYEISEPPKDVRVDLVSAVYSQ